ncbi:hypothetical protein FRB94_010385 [Tulasnella sp. JGI-2019a]|nr:hypothetical protein FRB94_010385 [Tulasnella sp. JGI-2019a]KAG9000167.1 hypothetical protein FRB93_012842 [Tulasnella sp. JGI-2019a]
MPKKTEPSAASLALMASPQSQQDTIMNGIENYQLPKAVAMRIAKSELPEYVKIGKEASLGITNSATVFINYLSATALDIAKARGAKTIVAADVLKAMEVIEMADQVPILEEELEAYRDGAKRTRPSTTGQKRKPSTAKDESAYKGKVKMPLAPKGAATATIGLVSAGPSRAAKANAGATDDDGDASEPNDDDQWDTEEADDQMDEEEDEEEDEDEEPAVEGGDDEAMMDPED